MLLSKKHPCDKTTIFPLNYNEHAAIDKGLYYIFATTELHEFYPKIWMYPGVASFGIMSLFDKSLKKVYLFPFIIKYEVVRYIIKL